MSRYIPENHPRRGKCSSCDKNRVMVADFGIDVMLVTGNGGFLRSVQSRGGVRTLRFKHALCGHCYRYLTKLGKPQIHLASLGVKKRLTRKQTEVAARKLARDLKKMQDES